MHMKRDLKGRYHKGFRAHPAAILQHGGRQDAARHLSHLVSHAELKLLHERVCLVVCTPHLRGEDIYLFYRKEKSKLCAVLFHEHRTLTSRLISSCRSGAERAVALIMVDVWLSVSFLMQR